MLRFECIWGAALLLAAPALAEIPDPYPGATLEREALDQSVAPYDFMLGSVERTGGAMRAKRMLRVSGTVDRRTYRVPDNISPDEVAAHYRREITALGYEVLFECGGRDCGKSTVWANSVFKQAMLYGPDTNQRYLAARHETNAGSLLSLYVIQRGNRRVYAHLEEIVVDPRPEDGVADGSGDQGLDQLTTELERQGYVIVPGVEPRLDGTLDDAAQARLSDLAGQLNDKQVGRLYLVCHVYGAASPDALFANSARCAEQARQIVDPEGVLGVTAFGAGPYVPRSREPRHSRLELVLP